MRKITIKIPKDLKDDLEIDLTFEDGLPFSDGLTNEEIVKEVTTGKDIAEYIDFNAMAIYLAKEMGSGEVQLNAYADGDDNEVIKI